MIVQKDRSQRSSMTNRALTNLLWMYAGANTQFVLQLVITSLLARLLLPSEFGLVSAATVVIGFAGLCSQLGVGPALVQLPEIDDSHVYTGFVVTVVLSLLIFLIVFISAPFMAAFYQLPELTLIIRVISCSFIINGLGIIASSLISRALKFRHLTLIGVTSYAIGYGIIGLSMAWLGKGVWALVGALVSQSITQTALLLYVQPHSKSLKFDAKSFFELMQFGGGFTLARFGNYIARQGDYLVVGRLLGAEALGFYGRAYQLMALPAILLGQVLDNVLFPSLAKIQDEPERLHIVYRRGATILAILLSPISVMMFFLAPELITLFLGDQWGEAIVPLQIFSIGLVFRTGYKLSDSIARAMGAVYRRAWRQWVYALLVMLGAIIGQQWNIVGVAWGVLFAVFVNYLLMAHLSIYLINMSWSSFLNTHRPAMLLMIIYGIQIGFSTLVLRSMAFSPVLVLVSVMLLSFVTAILILRFFAHSLLGEDGIWILQLLLKRVSLRFQYVANALGLVL